MRISIFIERIQGVSRLVDIWRIVVPTYCAICSVDVYVCMCEKMINGSVANMDMGALCEDR